MHLSKFTDYSLRALLLAASRQDQMITIRDCAETLEISQAHLKKVILNLARKGYVRAARGRGGGFTLGRPPAAINLGALIRDTEPDFALVECFRSSTACVLTPHCKLAGAFGLALSAFMTVLDKYTLQDFLLEKGNFALRRPVFASTTAASDTWTVAPQPPDLQA